MSLDCKIAKTAGWKGEMVALFVFLSLLVAQPAFANDGVDRHEDGYPNLLYHFPAPVEEAHNYTFLLQDAKGGADGDARFRWLQPHGLALVRLAAAKTYAELGAAKHPMAIFDLSAENGDTPIGWQTPPRGRHPGDSHDGGLNLDLGYFLTSLEGQLFSPDYSACSEHFVEEGDAYVCLGPADRLDVARQALFFTELFRLDREMFGKSLLKEIGVDAKIKEAILAQGRLWLTEKKFGMDADLLDRMEILFTHDRFTGWRHSHHHHSHVRLSPISIKGPYRQSFESLFEMERQLDANFAMKADPEQPFILRHRLFSQGLRRSIELEVLDPLGAKGFRGRMEGGAWHDFEAESSGSRLVLKIPGRPIAAGEVIRVEVQYGVDGQTLTKRWPISLPGLDPRLQIAIDPKQIKIHGDPEAKGISLTVSLPSHYRHYITRTEFFGYSTQSRRPLWQLETLFEEQTLAPFHVNGEKISEIQVEVEVAGRKRWRLPVTLSVPFEPAISH